MRAFPFILMLLLMSNCAPPGEQPQKVSEQSLKIDGPAIIAAANTILGEAPQTITAFVADRSAGGIHDYYSEGRYWWPDPDNPEGPYIRRDGYSNPENFTKHSNALREFSRRVTLLTAAFALTQEEKYANKAIEHLETWLINEATRMNPSLLYGQAIKGIVTGRGIGIIDSLKLINVAISVELLRRKKVLPQGIDDGIKDWFSTFGDWLTNHPYGKDEQTNNNNHSTWWGAQVAAYGRAAERPDLIAIAKDQFRSQLPIQIATDGSQPRELVRTRPFNYLNYNLEAWATFTMLLATEEENFWLHKYNATLLPYDRLVAAGSNKITDAASPQELSLSAIFTRVLPYLTEPQNWPYATEAEPAAEPRRQSYLVFFAWGLNDDGFMKIWQQLPPKQGDLHANLVVWQNL